MNGFRFIRVVEAQRISGHGDGLTAIFKRADGVEKPIPYQRVHEMEATVKKGLRQLGYLTRRDKSAKQCNCPVLASIMTAKERMNERRHAYRRQGVYA